MIRFHTSVRAQEKSTRIINEAWAALVKRDDLGFWQLPKRMQNWDAAQDFAAKLKSKSDHLVVIGLGGSALGGRALVHSFSNLTSPSVDFLFNTDPYTIDRFFQDSEKIKKSNFLLISKSGNTLEVACLLDILLQKLKGTGRNLSEAISVISEEKPSSLYNWAQNNKLDFLAHPLDVGGRFSALTPVGLVPAAFAGLDLDQLQKGALKAVESHDLVLQLASFYFDSFAREEFLSVFWTYCDQLREFSPWLIQLWAESLAKKIDRKGGKAPMVSTPVGYLGTCDQHSVLQQLMEGTKKKSLCFIRDMSLAHSGATFNGKGLPEFSYIQNRQLGEVFTIQSHATEAALTESGCSTMNLELTEVTEFTLAQLMMTFELVIGVLGEALNINAFDQPGVELGKKITKEKLEKNSRI